MLPIEFKIIEPDLQWVKYFEHEKKSLEQLIGTFLVSIHHIGSTAIPNMAAKPIIDIILETKNLDDIKVIEKLLCSHQYSQFSRNIIPFRSYLTSKRSNIHVNCHIYEQGDPQIIRHLRFRDYLTTHAKEAQKYSELKIQLSNKYSTDVFKYVEAKTQLVREIDANAKLWGEANENANYYHPQNPGNNIETWSIKKMVTLLEANFNIYLTHYPQYMPKVNFIRIPGYVLVDTGITQPYFNHVLDTHLSEPNVITKVNEFNTYFKIRKLPFSWWVTPNSCPLSLSQILMDSSLFNSKNFIGMSFNLDGSLISSHQNILHIEKINARKSFAKLIGELPLAQQGLKQYLASIMASYTYDDPFTFYAGYIDGQLIICSAMVTYAQCVGIYNLYLGEHDKNLHSLRQMEEHLLNEAKFSGYHLAVALILETQLTFYTRRGFKKLCVFKQFQQA